MRYHLLNRKSHLLYTDVQYFFYFLLQPSIDLYFFQPLLHFLSSCFFGLSQIWKLENLYIVDSAVEPIYDMNAWDDYYERKVYCWVCTSCTSKNVLCADLPNNDYEWKTWSLSQRRGCHPPRWHGLASFTTSVLWNWGQLRHNYLLNLINMSAVFFSAR